MNVPIYIYIYIYVYIYIYKFVRYNKTLPLGEHPLGVIVNTYHISIFLFAMGNVICKWK